MKKLYFIILLVLCANLGYSQIKPLVVKNELPASVVVYLNQVIDGNSRSSMVSLDANETKIFEVRDVDSSITMKFKEDLDKIPVNNNAYKRQLNSDKGDCVVCTVKKILSNPVSGRYYFKCVFRSGFLEEFENQ